MLENLVGTLRNRVTRLSTENRVAAILSAILAGLTFSNQAITALHLHEPAGFFGCAVIAAACLTLGATFIVDWIDERQRDV